MLERDRSGKKGTGALQLVKVPRENMVVLHVEAESCPLALAGIFAVVNRHAIPFSLGIWQETDLQLIEVTIKEPESPNSFLRALAHTTNVRTASLIRLDLAGCAHCLPGKP